MDEPRFQVLGVDFAPDAVVISYIDHAQAETRGIQRATQMSIDPSVCEPEILELIDACEALITAAEEQVRNPSATLQSRLRR